MAKLVYHRVLTDAETKMLAGQVRGLTPDRAGFSMLVKMCQADPNMAAFCGVKSTDTEYLIKLCAWDQFRVAHGISMLMFEDFK